MDKVMSIQTDFHQLLFYDLVEIMSMERKFHLCSWPLFNFFIMDFSYKTYIANYPSNWASTDTQLW